MTDTRCRPSIIIRKGIRSSSPIIGYRLWFARKINFGWGQKAGLTCFDLNTHRYVPFYVREGEQKYDSDLAVYKLYVDPAGCHLWTGSSQGMIVMRIDNDTIRPLKWNSEEERLLEKI